MVIRKLFVGSCLCYTLSVTSLLADTTCNPGYYLDSTTAICTICPAGSTCAGGTEAPVKCAGGTYTGDAYGNNATGATQCTACPTPADHMITEYPTSWFVTNADGTIDPTITVYAGGLQTWGSVGDVTTCRMTYNIINDAGSATDQSWRYSISTQKYDTDSDNRAVYYPGIINPGYYVETRYSETYCNTETNPQLYSYAHQCPIGSYCPGLQVPKCSETSVNVYLDSDTLGLYACPDMSGYTAKTETAGSTNQTQCFLEANTDYTDTKGTFHYKTNCYYE